MGSSISVLIVFYLGPDTEEWFAAGREVWGHPKKLGHSWITEPEGSGVVSGGLERPRGSLLKQLSVGPLEREARSEEIAFSKVLSLRIIPHPEKPEPQSAELIVTEAQLTPRKGSDGHLEFWVGPGEVAYPVRSDRDPLYRLKVLRVIDGYYGCFEGIVTSFGRIVKRLIP